MMSDDDGVNHTLRLRFLWQAGQQDPSPMETMSFDARDASCRLAGEENLIDLAKDNDAREARRSCDSWGEDVDSHGTYGR